MAINNVLKDKLGKILNPKIPRYEILRYDLTDDANPIKTGRKVNGKDEYAIRCNVGTLPNNTSNNYVLPITMSKINPSKVEFFGTSSDGELIPIPRYTGSSYVNYYVTSDVSTDVSTLVIISNSDLSRFTGYFSIYFTYKDKKEEQWMK